MIITRKSIVSGIERSMDLPITEEQIKRWQDGELIQRVMPHLNDSQREFLITGMTDEEWDDATECDEPELEDDEPAF